MKLTKIISLIVCALVFLSVFAACGDGAEKNTETQTEAKTDAQTEEQTEEQTVSQTEEQTEEQTVSQTEEQTEQQTETEKETEPEIIGDPVVLPDNTHMCTMVTYAYYSAFGVPDDVSSIVDAWPSGEKKFDRGLTYHMSDEDVVLFSKALVENSTETIKTVDGADLPLAAYDKAFIYNGAPGDADFGTRVAANLYEDYGIGVAINGPYIWLPGSWKFTEDMTIPVGFYTIVLYKNDGSAIAFTEYILQSFYEHTYYYDWE